VDYLLLMMLSSCLMIASPIAFPLAAYWLCRRFEIDPDSEVAGAFVIGIVVAVACFKFAQRCAGELV